MRIRTVKPEFWSNEDLGELPEVTRLFAIGLLNYADDEGYFSANERLIQAQLFPLQAPSRTIADMLDDLVQVHFLTLFKGLDGRMYGHICKFTENQVINKPKPSKIKKLGQVHDEYGTDTGEVLGERKGKEGKGKEGNVGCVAQPFPVVQAEKIYAAYPSRTGSQRKKDAIPRILSILESGEADVDLLLKAVKIYGRDCESLDDRTKVQQCATFFGPEKETWREYVDRAKEEKKADYQRYRKLDPSLADMTDDEMQAEMDRRRAIDAAGGNWRDESLEDDDDDTSF